MGRFAKRSNVSNSAYEKLNLRAMHWAVFLNKMSTISGAIPEQNQVRNLLMTITPHYYLPELTF